MARQYCPECGSEVPVDEETGVCHVGHPVPASAEAPAPAPAGPATFPIGADDDPPDDEPAPWVATVADDGAAAEPRREPDPATPPPPGTVTGSASPPPAGVSTPDAEVHTPASDDFGTGSDTPAPTASEVDEPEPFRFAGAPEPAGDDNASLEELAAMAATSGTDAGGDDDLASLGDDLRGDLSPTGAGQDDEFDLDSLEAAVADVGGQTAGQPATPAMTPEPPGPDAAPDPATAIAEVPQASEQPSPSEGPSEEDADLGTDGVWDDDPVSIRPDHDAGGSGGPGSSDPLDPTSFTASGRRVSATSSGGGGGGLVDKLKSLFGR